MNVIRRKIILGRTSLRFVKMHTRATEEAYFVDLAAERRFKVFHLRDSEEPSPVGIVYVPGFRSTSQGGDSIDILDSLNPSLNPSLNHFSVQCLPKRVLNLVLNPSLNPSLKF